MSTVQIKDLSTKTLTQTLDFVVQENAGGSGSYGKIAAISMMKGLNPITVYVSSTGGSNSVGCGGVLNPYASLSYAQSQITDASSSKIYLIVMSGVFTETNLSLKPNILINGNGSKLTISGNLTLDSSWATGGILFFDNFSELSINNVNLDFDALGASSSTVKFDRLFVTSSNVWTIKFNPLTTSSLKINDCFNSNGATTVLDIYNIDGEIINSTLGVQFTSSGAINDYNLYVISNVLTQDLNITNTSATDTFIWVSGGVIDGFRNVTSTSSGKATLIEANTITSKDITITGVNSFWETTNASSLPIFAGGSDSSNVTYVTISDSINANFDPSNYIPIDASVNGHLRGIDDALSSELVPLPSTQIAFGSDENTITGSNNFLWSDSTQQLLLGGGSEINFGQQTNNRMIVLYDTMVGDQYEFYGIGVGPSMVKYRVDQPESDHVFFTGTLSESETELARIRGNGAVVIGASSEGSQNIFDVVSTTKGSRGEPSMTTAQRLAISSPAVNTKVFDTDLSQGMVWKGSAWSIVY